MGEINGQNNTHNIIQPISREVRDLPFGVVIKDAVTPLALTEPMVDKTVTTIQGKVI